MQGVKSRLFSLPAIAVTLIAGRAAYSQGGGPVAPPAPAGVLSTVNGSISQFTYDREAQVEGFLLDGKTLVEMNPRLAAQTESALKQGDTVTVSGYAQQTLSGKQTVDARRVDDRTSGKQFVQEDPTIAAPFTGNGKVSQFNYGPDGAINGFLLDNGTFVTIPPFSSNSPSSIQVGSTVSFAGYARKATNGRTVVDAQSISINGQTLNLSATPVPPPPAPPAGAAPPPPPAPAAAPPAPVAPPAAPVAPPAPRA